MEMFSLLSAVLIAVGGVVFVNGWTDAPCAIATCVTSGALGERRAVVMAAVCNLMGIAVSCAVSPAVAMTVKGLVNLPDVSGTVALAVILCAMVATGLWAVAAWFFGIPTSESHALLAGLTGAALAVCGRESFNGKAWWGIAAGLVLSLLGGFAAGFLLTVAVDCFVQRHGGANTERGMKRMLVAGAASMAFMHGAQDGQKFIGIWLLAFSLSGGQPTSVIPLVVLCALLMGAGTLFGGGRIIRTLGERLVQAGHEEGIAADMGAALCLLFLTLAGLPVSTTHTKTAALMGTGAAKGRGRLDFSTAAKLITAWLLTFPACLLIAYFGMKGLLNLLG